MVEFFANSTACIFQCPKQVCSRTGEWLWYMPTVADLNMPNPAAGLALQTERSQWETKLTLAFIDAALRTTLQPGCTGVMPPFDLQVDRFAFVRYH